MNSCGSLSGSWPTTSLGQSPFWRQLLADTFGKRVVTLASQEGSAYGAAILAMTGTGAYSSVPEACRAVIQRAFTALQADRVITGTAAVNAASCRLLEKLGFQKTGESTGSFRKAADGKPIEFLGVSYVISKEDWKAVALQYASQTRRK